MHAHKHARRISKTTPGQKWTMATTVTWPLCRGRFCQREREVGGLLSVWVKNVCVCVCVIFVGPLLNPTAQDFCASSHYDEEKHVVPVESRTTSQPGQSVAHNGRFKVLDGVKYKQRKSHISLKSQELCKVEPLERHCYNFSQPVREQPVSVDFDVTLTNVCTHTHRTHRTSADYYTSSYSKSYFINVSFYSIYLWPKA